jgi:hypothetical protein
MQGRTTVGAASALGALAVGGLLILSIWTVVTPFGKAHAATGMISLVSSGLVASDSLTTGNTGYWYFGGDAMSQPGAKYSYSEDSQGLHIGVQSATGGTWSGIYAESPNTTASLFSAVVTLPGTPVPDNGFNTGIYVQTWDTNFIDYVDCLAVSVPSGYYWTVEQAYGAVIGSQDINTLYESPVNTMPHTESCAIITNGSNYLKVYLGGNVVVDRNNLTLNMPSPFNAYLEPQTSTASLMLTGTWTDYYATAGEGVSVNNAPPGGTAELVSTSGSVLASAPVASNGTATMLVGGHSMPLSANVEVLDSGQVVASTSGPVTVWGGDVYALASSTTTSTSTTTTTTTTSSMTLPIPVPLP